ncbi:hypothetical protein [Streptomyces tailanensis]|uniref:hypothetical protein n=1 Tax=Streptomyces tailanensis TaxID=2569858 RepID=UPI00122E9871|nr:hypothetical protein [Streptomyces tailanensis]
MNSERPDNPENPDEGPEPDAIEEIRAAGDDASEPGMTAESDAAAEAETTAEPGSTEAEKADGTDRTGETDETAQVTGSDVDDGDASEDGDRGHVVEVGGGAEPSRRRRSRVAVVSMAVAVLLVGGGGAYLATTASSGSGGSGGSSSPGGDGTPPPLALDGYTEGSNGIAPGEPNPNGVTYRASGELPDGPDSAPVYAVKGEVTAAEVARLAKALGVEGTPTAEGEIWRVGSVGDSSGPTLQVNKQSPGAWTFSKFAAGTDDCKKGDVCAFGTTTEVGDPVSEAVAKKAAAPVFKAVGQDDAKLDASQLLGAVRVVNADPEVGGLPTYGWTTGVQVGADGQVVGGNGNLKSPVKSDTYPVVDAERALDLMNGSGQEVGPEPLTTASTPDTVTVEKAEFGLASHQVDGRPTLVPSWMFEVRPTGAAESYTVTHPAIDPEYLASPEPRSEPTEAPADPDAPGDEPTANPASRDVEIQGYTVDGDKLTVTFWGGVCSDYSASATEEEGKVTVTVTDTPWEDKVCILIAKAIERTVDLDQPLGDRAVVGSDGEKIPEGGISELEP